MILKQQKRHFCLINDEMQWFINESFTNKAKHYGSSLDYEYELFRTYQYTLWHLLHNVTFRMPIRDTTKNAPSVTDVMLGWCQKG